MSRIRNWVVVAGLLVLIVSLASGQEQSSKKRHGAPADSAAGDQTTLDKLDVVHGRQDISIEITASSPVTPKVTTLKEPDRVVLDFPNTVPGTETRHINVDSEGVKSVRMGVNAEMPPTTRVVVDLEEARDYQLLPDANRIIVKFRNVPGAMTTAEKKPAVVPVATKTAEAPISKPAPKPVESSASDTKTLASLNPTSLPGPSQSSASTAPAPAPAKPVPPANSTAASSTTSKPAPMPATTSSANPASTKSNSSPTMLASAAPAPAPVQNSAPAAASAVKPTTTAPPASTPVPQATTASTPAPAPAQPTTVAAAQPAPAAADPAPANTPDVSKDDKSKAAPELKKADYDPKTYIIGEQDVLGIDVWKEKDISQTVVVRPDGKVTIPLVDEVYVVGLTPLQLQSLLEDKLKPFLTVPQVTVIVKEISSRKVYLMGQVGRTGPFLINSTTTVLQLIAQAGGLRDFAKRKKIYIMRSENGKTEQFRFNYDEVIKGKRLEQNIVLRPGDTIVVP